MKRFVVFIVALICVVSIFNRCHKPRSAAATPSVNVREPTESPVQASSCGVLPALGFTETDFNAAAGNSVARTQYMQNVANYLAVVLNTCPPRVIADGDLSGGDLACFSSGTHTVHIRTEHLRDGSVADVLNSICHEMYHARQYDIMFNAYSDPAVNATLSEYRYNTAHYIDADDDYDGYRAQALEEDARAFAQAMSLQIYTMLQ